MLLANENLFSPSGLKFFRREDLTPEIRFEIAYKAYNAQKENLWGHVTNEAQKWNVSRNFIYKALSDLKEILPFSLKEKPAKTSLKESMRLMLSLRFEARASISGVSAVMKRQQYTYSATGSISQFLKAVGGQLNNTVQNPDKEVKIMVFLNDEIFAKTIPILISVDPKSSVILRIEQVDSLTKDKWVAHYKDIGEHGFGARLFVSDAGSALCAANSELDVLWQLDTYHGIAHRFGLWDNSLKIRAYNIIKTADEHYSTLASAVDPEVVEKRLNRYTATVEKGEKLIELYDNFHYLYRVMLYALRIFESDGTLHQQKEAEETITAALKLMKELGHKKITADVDYLEKRIEELLLYFVDTQTAVKNCEAFSDNEDALKSLFLAWQWNKAVVKAKETERRNKAKAERDFYLELAQVFIGNQEGYELLKERVFEELDGIVQASSLVECINSILRMYLNGSKNQINQNFLNLFMFYHNHRRYLAGKRKGKTPMEILTGKKQEEDWIDLLLQKEELQEVLRAA